MRALGTFASANACAVRSTMRSWKEKRWLLRTPRAGDTKPAATNARMVLRGRRRRRSTSSTPYGCVTCCGTGRRSALRGALARGRGGLCGLDALGRLARRRGRCRLRRGGLRDRGGLALRGRLPLQARTQRFHEVDHLRARLRRLAQRDLLALDLLLHRSLDARGDLVRVQRRIERLARLRVDQLLRELELDVLHL